VGGAPPPPLGAAPQGGKNPEKFGPKRAGFGRFLAPEDHAQEGGGGGSRPLPDPALGGGRRGPPGPPAAVGGSPRRPLRRAIKRLGPDQSRSSEASDAASGRSRPGIYRNQGPGDPPPFQGLTGSRMGTQIGQCLWTGRSSGAYDLPSDAVGAPCSAWHPDAGVARPVARANRNAAMRGIPQLGDLLTAIPDALSDRRERTDLGQAP